MSIYLHLEISGNQIRGEAGAGGYEDEIEVESFTFGLTTEYQKEWQKQARGAPKRAPKKIKYDNVSISKLFDDASINLARYMSRRTPFQHARLTVDQHLLMPGGKKDQNPVLTFDLEDGYIESVKLSISDSSKGATVKETINLTFRKVDVAYYPETTDHTRKQRKGAVVFEGPTSAVFKR